MTRLSRGISAVGGVWVIVFLGVVFVAFGAARALLLGSEPIAEAVIEFTLIGVPGLGLLYCGYWLPRSPIHPDVHPRIVGWCLGGIGVMLGVVGLLVLNPAGSVDRPLRAAAIAGGLGAIGGIGIGINNGRALSRAREAEQRSQELERTKDELEQQNRELQRTQAELEETVAHLQTANERLEHFAYAASHDLQEPLRMVSSYLLLLESRYADDLDDEAQVFIDFAVDGAERMRSMVESLLEYSQVTTGSQSLEPTDTEGVLEDVLNDLQLRIEETDATITTDDLPTVVADSYQLAQLFRNLLTNALMYSGEEPPRIHVGVDSLGDRWQFFVDDEGVGIDPTYHDRIFRVFERLPVDEDSSEPGAEGLGLALCQRIVERHGGEIWVESEPSEGATFYFTIPETEGSNERDPGPAAHSSLPG